MDEVFHPTPDAAWGLPCTSYQIQMVLPAGASTKLAQLSRIIDQYAPGSFLIPPKHTLHVTCYSLISPRDISAQKDEYWQAIRPHIVAHFEAIPSIIQIFPLEFFALQATSQGVIAIGRDEGEIMRLRSGIDAVLSNIDGLQIRSSHPAIIHATLCRYARENQIPNELPNLISEHQVAITGIINEVRLVAERIYPSLDTETLMSAKLRGTRHV